LGYAYKLFLVQLCSAFEIKPIKLLNFESNAADQYGIDLRKVLQVWALMPNFMIEIMQWHSLQILLELAGKSQD